MGWVCLSSLGTDKAPIRITAGVDWRNGNQDPQQSIERIEGVDAIPIMGGEGEASLPTAGWNTPRPEDRKMKSVSKTDESYVTMDELLCESPSQGVFVGMKHGEVGEPHWSEGGHHTPPSSAPSHREQRRGMVFIRQRDAPSLGAMGYESAFEA